MNNLCQFHYNRLVRKLTSIRWIQKWKLDKNSIDNFLRSSEFIRGFNSIFESKNFSCENTLSICKPLLDKLSYPYNQQDWLGYIYQYTLNKSFPEAVSIILLDNLNPICEIYLRVLRVICEAEKDLENQSWQYKYPINFLDQDEENHLENSDEYKKFIKAFKHNYTYEMMKLSKEVMNYTTLDHVCGVHYVAMYIARQLKNINIPIDLGRVSGAAAGHDIGKYGCRISEIKKTPRLHYFYTDEWFKRYGINYIRNIALNHSTWDLELENLPIESLILIYSDFRVKGDYMYKDGRMKIYGLEDSFYVILNKLENLDKEKEKRYRRVYAKLKDFEDFLINLNIDILSKKAQNNHTKILCNNYSLLQGHEIISSIKNLAIMHNIKLMYELRDEFSLDAILETARSEKDWKNLREYIRIFQEYSTYLTQKQKLQTISFLYDNLTHPEDDIRRHCAELIGILIAIFDENYRKELPENVSIHQFSISSTDLFTQSIDIMLNHGHNLVPSHKFYLGYSLSIMINSLFTHCNSDQLLNYRKILLGYYKDFLTKNTDSHIFLLQSAKSIPLEPWDENINILYDYILVCINKRNNMIKEAALDTILNLSSKGILPKNFVESLKKYLEDNLDKEKSINTTLLLKKISDKFSFTKLSDQYRSEIKLNDKKITEIFLSNLKSATDWIKKKNQIDLLLEYAIESHPNSNLHTSIHFCNLLKVSAVESVRNHAGYAILKIMPKLSISERNEVAVELLRALEIEGNRFTEYIPGFTGRAVLWLQPKELDEIIEDLAEKIKSSNANLKSLILKTMGITISNYDCYAQRFEENENDYENRLRKMLGILLCGLGDYNIQVKQAAFSVLGKDIFGTNCLSLYKKEHIFTLIAKKLLTLVSDNRIEDLLFLTNSAGLNHIYRFISDYTFFVGKINIPIPKKVAFFPGTFDPFSLSHKQIATCIRNEGYEVYLAVDEFSWSKKTLPSLLRRDIISMSIANELNIYIYPDDEPTNLSNEDDLKRLLSNFPYSQVYMAIGSDVLLNATCYNKNSADESLIYSLPHIIFQRNKTKKLLDFVKRFSSEVIFLTLPAKYSEISSTQIRNYIDESKDISSLVDPLAQQYIYENGFYQREPQDKSTIKNILFDTILIEEFSFDIAENMFKLLGADNKKKFIDKIKEIFKKPSGRVFLLKDLESGEVLGFSIFHWLRSSMIYEETYNTRVAEFIRTNSLGRVICIDGIYIKNAEKNRNLEQIIITETLAFSISRDYECAIYKPFLKEFIIPSIDEHLKLIGFTGIEGCEESHISVVNMSSPCVINFDIENILKEPFRSNLDLRQVIISSRKKLMYSLTNLYPGELVLTFDINYLHQCMINKICRENGVSTKISETKKLGETMCVPYGDIFDRYIIPNTVTKALHTEKFFEPSMENFNICEFPHYLKLKDQVKMLKSFNRPIILVDNILHKGYRMRALDPLFKRENITVKKIIAGIMSGRGKDLMDMQNRNVESIYFIPRMKMWFNENALYPFIGGDSVWRGSYPKRNLLPSINLIMPYTSPTFIRGASTTSVYNLSKICIENSLEILETLEEQYHLFHERNLTLSNLGQVFTIPRSVDKGNNIEYDLNKSASSYLKNDLESLFRLEKIIKGF